MLPSPVRGWRDERTASSNKGMKLTRPGQLRCLAAYPRCSPDSGGGSARQQPRTDTARGFFSALRSGCDAA
jgi:hypothetical protein